MKIGQIWPKIESSPPDRILHQKGKEVLKMTKVTIFSENFAISGSFNEKPSKMGKT